MHNYQVGEMAGENGSHRESDATLVPKTAQASKRGVMIFPEQQWKEAGKGRHKEGFRSVL
jgi:hypothetical protein